MENGRVKIGNIDIHKGNAKLLTKEQFSFHYKNIIGMDINLAWDQLQKELEKDGGTKKISSKGNENKHGANNENASTKPGVQGENNPIKP